MDFLSYLSEVEVSSYNRGVLFWYLLLFLVLPFLRYVLGFKFWRYSSVTLLVFSLASFLYVFRRKYIGLGVWFFIFLLGLIFGILVYLYIKDKRRHYFVKVSLVIVSIFVGTYFGVWFVGAVSGIDLFAHFYVSMALLLLDVGLYEYVALFSRKGAVEFIRRGVLMLLISVLWGYGMYWEPLITIIGRLEIGVFIAIISVVLYFIGGWRNLTLVEFFRFRSIAKKEE